MKLVLFLLTLSLQGANTYYVSSSGNDSNNGSVSTPFLTLQHAVSTVGCGDTINVVANGFYVNGDVTLKYIPNCVIPTIIQSSLFSSFLPDGFRTDPAVDCADSSHCLYGRLQLTTGITWTQETHGSNISEYGNCGVSSITGGDTLVLSACTQLPNLQNGSQIEIEIDTVNGLQLASPPVNATTLPVGLSILTHYWVRDCSVSPACGTTGATMRLSATPGGATLSIGSCLAVNFCAKEALGISEPLQFVANSSTITSPDNFTVITNGTPVTLSAVGMQVFGSLPPEISTDTIYYVQNISGRTFKLSTDIGGNNIITPSTVGLGPSILANSNAANNWVLKGLEFYSPAFMYFQIQLGGLETSIYGTVHHIEIGHNWFHDDPAAISGVVHSIAENVKGLYIHDNYITGARTSESQAITGAGSPGPTAIVNNFLEAATEITLYGGNGNNSGISNGNKLFQGNYYYKPPAWKIDASAGAPTVGVDTCIYDTTDPLRSGGEWHTDTNTGIKYRCDSNGLWQVTALTVPTAYTLKNSFESKSLKDTVIIGNLHNYSVANNQSGQCYAFHQNYDSGAAMANNNITAIYNKCLNVYYFVSLQSLCLSSTAVPCLAADGTTNYAKNHTIAHNIAFENSLMCGINIAGVQTNCGFSLYQFNYNGGSPQTNLTFAHNTLVTSGNISSNPTTFFYAAASSGVPNNGKSSYWNYKNNILTYDFQGESLNGGGMISAYFLNSNFSNNVLVNSTGAINYSSPGATNTFCIASNCFERPASNTTVQYANLGTLDLHLLATSPYSAANVSHTVISDDLTDLGADVNMVNLMTSGAALGTPPWDQKGNLRLGYGSTKVIFYFNTTGTAVCTVSVYNSLVKIAANLVTSVADSTANAISIGTWREIPVTGLTASTKYWYNLDCGSGIVLPGFFVTKASGSGSSFLQTYGSTQNLTICTDKAMATGCTTQNSTSPIVVSANSIVYFEVTPGNTVPQVISMLVAP